MPRVIIDPGDLPDHFGDSRQSPQLVLVAPSKRPFDECLLNLFVLCVGHPRLAAGATCTAKSLLAALRPSPIPAEGSWATDLQPARDLCLCRTLRKHLC
jgi:hypothetical protein